MLVCQNITWSYLDELQEQCWWNVLGDVPSSRFFWQHYRYWCCQPTQSLGRPRQHHPTHLWSCSPTPQGQHPVGAAWSKQNSLEVTEQNIFFQTFWISFKAWSQSGLMSLVSLYFRCPALRWVAILRRKVNAWIHRWRMVMAAKENKVLILLST